MPTIVAALQHRELALQANVLSLPIAKARGFPHVLVMHNTNEDLALGDIHSTENEHKRSVRADTVVALAVALGVSSDYLLGLSEATHAGDAL